MNDERANRRESEGYRLLTARLAEDAEKSATALESLRRGLVRYFERHGSRSTAEDGAHEALRRLAARLGEGHAVDDLPRFALGIARNILREGWRRDAREAQALLDMSRAEPGDACDESAVSVYEDCLRELPPQKRSLLEEYYRHAGAGKSAWRERLAATRGVSLNALRIQVFRAREELRDRMKARARDGR
jgi:DNA-directed RNA polymerase specialized sigma24 family protein